MTVTCPHCQSRLKFPDGMGAGRVRCPRCQQVFAVSTAPVPVPDRARPGAERPGSTAPPGLPPTARPGTARSARPGGFPTKALVGGGAGCLVLLALGWLFFFSGLLGGSMEYASYVPPGAIAIVRVNTAALRGSDLFKQVAGQVKGLEQRMWDEAKGLKLGLNDIDEVFIAGTQDKDIKVIVVRTAKPMSWDDVLAEPGKAKKESVEGIEVVEVRPGPNGVYAALVAPRTLCFAPAAQPLKDALARVRTGERPALAPDLRDIVGRVRGYDHYVAVASLAKLLLMATLPPLPLPVAGELGGVKGGGVGVSIGSSIDLRVVAWFAEADKAKSIREKAQQALDQAFKDMDAARGHVKGDQAAMIDRMLGVLRSVAIGQSGSTLIATARVDAETSKTFAEQMAAQVGKMQSLASSGPAVQTPAVPGPKEKLDNSLLNSPPAGGQPAALRAKGIETIVPPGAFQLLENGLLAMPAAGDFTRVFVELPQDLPANYEVGCDVALLEPGNRYEAWLLLGERAGIGIVNDPGASIKSFVGTFKYTDALMQRQDPYRIEPGYWYQLRIIVKAGIATYQINGSGIGKPMGVGAPPRKVIITVQKARALLRNVILPSK